MRVFFYIALLIFSTSVFGQTKVDPQNLNADLLNELILKEVNALRKRKRLDTLHSDQILTNAANDHAAYMTENELLTHDQKRRDKRTPYDRVVYHGGSHNTVGENIQTYSLANAIKKSKGKLTYQNLAKDIVKAWIKSKPHYENLINPAFKTMGHAFQLKNGMLYCCQVLGSNPFSEKYTFQKGTTLSVKAKKPCLNCKLVKQKIDKGEASIGWYTVSNDSVFYWNRNHYTKGRFYQKKKKKFLLNTKKNNLRKIFSGQGVIAVDLIHNEQFDCKGKASFHNSLYHNGYYLGYIDKSMLKAKDMHPSDQFVQIFVGMKPAFKDTFYQVDLNLVKRQRPCTRSSIVYVQPDYLKPAEYFAMPTPKITLDKHLIIEDSVVTRVSYKRNQTNQDTTIFQPLISLLDSLIKAEHHIEKITFTGVASIEGTEKANKKLFLKRGTIIEEYIKRYYPNVPFEGSFYENFDDFRAGLVSVGYSDVTEVSDDTLRMFANDNRDDKEIADLLDQTRFSSVKVVYRDYFPIEEGSYGLSVERIQDLIVADEIREIIPLYLVMANQAIEGDSTLKQQLLGLDFPIKKSYGTLHWYKFLMELAVGVAEVNSQRLNELKEVGAIQSNLDDLEFRLLFNLFNENQALDISDYQAVIEKSRSKKQVAWVECLDLISKVENYQITSDSATLPILEKVIQKKFELKKTYFICQYLISWGYTAEPYALLAKFAKRPGQLPKLYAQYLKLGYFLGEFNNEREWKKIRNVLRNLAKDSPTSFCALFKWDQMGVRSFERKEIATLFCETCRK